MTVKIISLNFKRGFTLIELVVVIAIVGIMAAIAIPYFSKMIADQRLRSAAQTLVSDLTYMRSEAITQGVGQYLYFQPTTTNAAGAATNSWCYVLTNPIIPNPTNSYCDTLVRRAANCLCTCVRGNSPPAAGGTPSCGVTPFATYSAVRSSADYPQIYVLPLTGAGLDTLVLAPGTVGFMPPFGYAYGSTGNTTLSGYRIFKFVTSTNANADEVDIQVCATGRIDACSNQLKDFPACPSPAC